MDWEAVEEGARQLYKVNTADELCMLITQALLAPFSRGRCSCYE